MRPLVILITLFVLLTEFAPVQRTYSSLLASLHKPCAANCKFAVQLDPVVIDKKEAQNAFSLIKEMRKDPNKYYRELGYEKDLQPSTLQLIWNDTLAKVAENKAFDMASRNYYGHVDPDGFGINHFIAKSGYKLNSLWTVNKADNYFESLTANLPTGEAAVKFLVKDSLTPSFGHRKHLLGLDKWNSTLKDVGIGFARRDSGSTYSTYVCVIIAKHDW